MIQHKHVIILVIFREYCFKISRLLSKNGSPGSEPEFLFRVRIAIT